MEKDYILQISGIDKTFTVSKVLDNISFNIERGTVHALVGENGAGKSTLIKILAGIHRADSGTVLLNGKKCRFKTPVAARRAGITVIHQEIKLAEPLSVTENMFLGELLQKNGVVDWNTMRKKAAETIEELNVDIDVDAPVSSLSVAKKQIVEIAHALNRDSKVLIMDEPSAVLTDRELEVMFKTVNRLREKGITIIYISHRLDEIFNICDNVTVLRDGKHIKTCPISDITRKDLITMMVGREMGSEYPKEKCELGSTVLDVKNLNCGMVRDVSFSVAEGEVFGISGLVGSGRTELARAIVGIDKKESGEIYVRGKRASYHSFKDAINDGFGLIPEDRKLQGLVQIMSIRKNITLANLRRVMKLGIIQKSKENRLSEEYAEKLYVTASSLEAPVQNLSGGNQQKVVIAKWVFKNSEIIILDEPTRGVDVGAKAEIYKLINALVKEGKTIIMISSEMPELLGMCDRIMVMREGTKSGELSADEATQEKIMALCT